MPRLVHSLVPLLVGALALGATAWLWHHERQTQDRRLRDNFDNGLRATASRIEQRMSSYELALRGTRGLFEASDRVTREDFTNYVDGLLAGADLAGLRAIAYAPWLRIEQLPSHIAAQRADGIADYDVKLPAGRRVSAPMTYIAPPSRGGARLLGHDPLDDPDRVTALNQARDSGRVAITQRLQLLSSRGGPPEPGFLMVMPLYTPGRRTDSLEARREHLAGFVSASFSMSDVMSSLYGEGTPGLDVRVYDGVALEPAALMFPRELPPPDRRQPAPRFEAQEYVGFAGHSWTLAVRSTPAFDAQFSGGSDQVIAIAGGVLSLLLGLLTWQLVTARDRAHAAAHAMTRQLRDGAERYRRIVETASEGIWMLDAHGRTSFANPKLQRMLGVDAAVLLGRPWTEFVDDDDRPRVQHADMRELQRSLAERPEVALRRSDGRPLWVTVSVSIIPGAEPDAPAGLLAMVTDITERKLAEADRAALEEKLRQSQKMEAIGTLAGGIAHDFNNILAAILGNVALLRQELAPQEAGLDVRRDVRPEMRPEVAREVQHARLEQIAKAGVRARSLVQQITAFSRQQPRELVVQPLAPLVEETVELMRSTLPALVVLELQLPQAPVSVAVDATQLQQVLMNLCTNAWHALQGRAGRIVVGLEALMLESEAAQRLGGLAPGAHAHLWVGDNGCGMDEATRQRVFEPFFTTKPVGQGTGLGLAVAHGIVAAHRGAITLVSTPGLGTTFDLYLPLAADAGEPPSARTELPAVLGRGEHVLYVDDDPVMVLMVEGLLQRAGYRVSTGGDPQAALTRVRADPAGIDVVVSDYNMPGLSGIDLARALLQLRPELPVVITSGYVTDVLRAEAKQAGVRQVLQKEYTLEQLAEVVAQALSARPVGSRGPAGV